MPRDPDLTDVLRSAPVAPGEGTAGAHAPASPHLPFPVKDLRKWRIGIAVGAQAAVIILGIAAALLSSKLEEGAEEPGHGSSLDDFAARVEEDFAAHLRGVISGSTER
ncbi:MAG TPA: hypothetical protein VMT52_05790 [Planctomycetota bacterium]|nr:hypothetical protein [Planctomycetota bacterium]